MRIITYLFCIGRDKVYKKKESHHYLEEAAIGGHPFARHRLTWLYRVENDRAIGQ